MKNLHVGHAPVHSFGHFPAQVAQPFCHVVQHELDFVFPFNDFAKIGDEKFRFQGGKFIQSIHPPLIVPLGAQGGADIDAGGDHGRTAIKHFLIG